jgi:hypothetical protein
MDYSKLFDIASKVSLAVVLMVILVGGVNGYWVAGSTYREMVADRNEWKNLALQGTNLAVRTLRPAHHVYGASEPFPAPLPKEARPEDVKEKLEEVAKTHARQQP